VSLRDQIIIQLSLSLLSTQVVQKKREFSFQRELTMDIIKKPALFILLIFCAHQVLGKHFKEPKALPKRWSVVVTPAQDHKANDPNNENDASGVSCKTLEEILEAIKRVLETKCTAVCQAVGVADNNKIPDEKMTASSLFYEDYQAYYGRLNGTRGNGAWCPKTKSDRSEFLQIDMGTQQTVCAVATQGERRYRIWSRSYKLKFSLDGATYKTYKENNVDKVFPGNKDQNGIVRNSLSTDVQARFVRFYPVKYGGIFGGWPCLRVEIYVRK